MEQKKLNTDWLIALLVVIAFGLGIVLGQYYLSTDIGKDAVTAKLNQFMEQNNIDGVITNMTSNGTIYLATIEIRNEGATQVAITKDGTKMMPVIISLDTVAPVTPAEQPTSNDTVQFAIPKVELFVMSECPYGLQMERGIIPAIEALNGTVDFKLKFVYYAMHGEKEVMEQQRQYCIQKNTPNIIPYLKCYIASGNSTECLPLAQIDRTVMQDCVTDTENKWQITANLNNQASWVSGKFPKFTIYDAENQLYGVQGSPTLVINGKTAQVGRDSQSLLNAICDGFKVKPESCNTQLSSTAPSAGFGAGIANTQAGQCS